MDNPKTACDITEKNEKWRDYVKRNKTKSFPGQYLAYDRDVWSKHEIQCSDSEAHVNIIEADYREIKTFVTKKESNLSKCSGCSGEGMKDYRYFLIPMAYFSEIPFVAEEECLFLGKENANKSVVILTRNK